MAKRNRQQAQLQSAETELQNGVERNRGTLAPEAQIANLGDDPRARIEVIAYLLAEKRGFAPGCELDDWCAAEAEVYNRQNHE
jgi:hypothetical protein